MTEEKKKAIFVVCRHGQTEYNKQKLMTGQLDVSLTPVGEEQARQTGKLVRHIEFDKIYASTLSRAFNTAALALEHSRTHGHFHLGDGVWDIEKRSEIIEKHTGDFTGRNHQTDPEIINWPKGFDVKLPNGESRKDVVDRVKTFFDDEILPRLKKGENILVVCHAGVVDAFHVALGVQGPDAPRQKIENAAPHVFEYEDGRIQKHYLIANSSEKTPNKGNRGPKSGA